MQKHDPDVGHNERLRTLRRARGRGVRWLRFEPALEAEFRREVRPERARIIAVATATAFVMMLGFGLLDLIALSVLTPTVSALLLYAACPVLLLGACAASLKRMQPYAENLVTGCLCVAYVFFVYAYHALITAPDRLPFGWESASFFVTYLYFFSGLSTRRALIMGWSFLVAILISMEFGGLSTPLLVYVGFFIGGMNLVGTLGGYVVARGYRHAFLDRAVLRELSETDPLTGLLNRRAFDEQMTKIWRLALRKREAITLAMIDIDHFKSINDTYGHQVGDAALRAVAGALTHHARRPLDIVGRRGGDEFSCAWMTLGTGEAASHMQQVLASVRAALCKTLDDAARVHSTTDLDEPRPQLDGQPSCSIGFTHVRPSSKSSVATLFSLADRAVYLAKDNGRDQVAVWPPLPEGRTPAAHAADRGSTAPAG